MKIPDSHVVAPLKSKRDCANKYETRNVAKSTNADNLHRETETKNLCDEEKDFDEALSMSIYQIEFEKCLNETLARSFEEEKMKLLTLLGADDVDFDVLANQWNKIWSGEDVVAHRGETMSDRSALILAIIEMFGHDCTILQTKHVAHHIISIREYCLAIDSDVTYQKYNHQKERNSTFNIYSINDYLVNIQIKGDGNCLWSSVSHTLIGDYALMISLRLLTAASLLHFSDSFADILSPQVR